MPTKHTASKTAAKPAARKSIAADIDAAKDGDEITVAKGTYAEGELKSDFPRITGQGFPVNERGKAIGPSGSAPETQVGSDEKAAEGKREPEAAGINDRLRESAAANDAAAKI